MSIKKDSNNSIMRLLSIIPHNRWLFWRGFLQYSTWIWYHLFNVIMLGLIIKWFESGKDVKTLLLYYGSGAMMLHILMYSVRNIGWTELLWWYQKIIHREYVEKFVYLDLNKCERIWSGKLLSIMEKWMNERASFISEWLEKFTALFFSLLYVIYCLRNLWSIYIITFTLLFIVIIFVWYYFNNYMLIARRERVHAGNIYVKHLIRIIMSKAEVMQSWNQQYEMNKLDKPLNDAIQANKNMNPYIHFFFFWPAFIIDIWRICLFITFIYWYVQSENSLSSLVTIGAALLLFDTVLIDTLSFYKDITKKFDVVQRLRDLVDNNKPENQYNNGKDFTYIQWDIIVQKVNFWYGDNSVFDNFSLELKWWTKTAFVGESGWGKTTLIKLLAWYLRPDSGEIIIDGQKLSEVKLTDYYRHIGYLTQEPSVFDGTVWENLTYALDDEKMERWKEDKREKDIHRIITLAKCEFIYEFEHWLQTEIGERWIRLSGWQKQRLAIAKIMLKNPNIILLDEPTSALDSFNEELVTEALHNLFKWRTVIVVAHRLQTVKNADRILYIEWWKVIEDGTHTSLIKKNGNYKKMLDLQSGF